jgi:hypothetical protein
LELLVFLWFPLAASSTSLYSRLKDFFFVVGGKVVSSFIVNLTMILGLRWKESEQFLGPLSLLDVVGELGGCSGLEKPRFWLGRNAHAKKKWLRRMFRSRMEICLMSSKHNPDIQHPNS